MTASHLRQRLKTLETRSLVVVLACFWTNFCILGIQKSSALVFVALIKDFTLTRKDAAWPSGILGFSVCCAGILSGYINQYFSIRCIMMFGASIAALSVSLCSIATEISHVVLLYGALQGVGIGLIVPMTHVALNQHFDEHKALAAGIAFAGSSIGSFLFPPLIEWMLNEFSLQGTFLLLGGIMLNSLAGIALLKKQPSNSMKTYQQPCGFSKRNLVDKGSNNFAMDVDKKHHQKASTSTNNPKENEVCKKTNTKLKDQNRAFFETLKASLCLTKDIMTNRTYLLVSGVFAVYFSVWNIYITTVVDFALDKLIPKSQSVFLVSFYSFGDIGGRLAGGLIGDLKCFHRNLIVCFYLLSMSGLLMIFPFCSTFSGLATISVLLGIFSGGILVNFSATLTELMGLKKLPLAIGFSNAMIGITSFLRPIVIGYFRDQHGSYNDMFLFSAIFLTALTTIWLVAINYSRVKTFFQGRKKLTNEENQE